MAMQVSMLLQSLVSYTSVKQHFNDPKWAQGVLRRVSENVLK